jgi:predicted AAA+ superfamily ATPase
MTLTKKKYMPRLVDNMISRYLKVFGAVSIEGPKWCGKTWTSAHHANTINYLLDTANDYSYREAVRLNPKIALEGVRPVAIDEWQEAPAVWDAVRQAVDQADEKGLFILTGSVSRKGEKGRPVHSGAGRIASVGMRPMTLFESGDSDGIVSLRSLAEENIDFEPFHKEVDLDLLAHLCYRGGWPGNIQTPAADAGLIPIEYLKKLTTSDMSLSDGIAHDPNKVSLLLRAIARNTATTVSNATLQRDIQNGSNTLSMPTIYAYLDALKRLYVLEEIPGWNPPLRSKARIRRAPKRIFTDPSLALAALGTTPGKLIRDLPAMGYVFENLCLRDLLVYSAANGAEVYHYSDNSNLELDAIIEFGNGSYFAVEIKLNPGRIPEAITAINRFKSKMRNAGFDAPTRSLVITGGGVGQLRDDGIMIVPISALRE